MLFCSTARFGRMKIFKNRSLSRFPVSELLQSHLPILNGSLNRLAAQPAKHKLYLHINNTNPILWDFRP